MEQTCPGVVGQLYVYISCTKQNLLLHPALVKGARHWHHELKLIPQSLRCPQHGWQVQAQLFASTSWQQRDPSAGNVQSPPCREVLPGHPWGFQIAQGVSDKLHLYPIPRVEL